MCDRLLAEGHSVVAVDNFVTGLEKNVAHLDGHAQFRLIRHDITHPLPVEGPLDALLNMASPASPKDYLQHAIETLDVGSAGTRNMLELARAKGARFLLTSTSECYGDPPLRGAPQMAGQSRARVGHHRPVHFHFDGDVSGVAHYG